MQQIKATEERIYTTAGQGVYDEGFDVVGYFQRANFNAPGFLLYPDRAGQRIRSPAPPVLCRARLLAPAGYQSPWAPFLRLGRGR